MEMISTSAFAKELNIAPNKLFEVLESTGLIQKQNDHWILTDNGKKSGGELKHSEKYGNYIVWPTSLSKEFEKILNEGKEKTLHLNATSIGEYFGTSSQRINLILSEIGLIEKDVAGWNLTKLGRLQGGKQYTHEVSGAHYVLWPENILHFSRLNEIFSHEKGDTNDEISKEKQLDSTEQGFREKFEAKHRTQDGHYVRSKAEMIIDNLLYQYGLVHAYERKLPIEEDVYSDFFIPPGNGRPQGVYIEYWGLENDLKYLDRKKKKIEIYKNNELPLIELNEQDIQNLDDILPRKLLSYKIKVY